MKKGCGAGKKILLAWLAALMVINGVCRWGTPVYGVELALEEETETLEEGKLTESGESEPTEPEESEEEEPEEEEPEEPEEGEPTEPEEPTEKAEGIASVSIESWMYTPDNSSAQTPIPVSETNGTDQVTYYYKENSAPDGAYTQAIPSQAGSYTIKAVFAETEDYRETEATAGFSIYKATPVISFEKVEDELEETGFFSMRVSGSGEAELIITTDNEDVAAVDQETGIIRFIGSGVVRIIAGMEESRNYQALTVAMELSIEKVKKLAAIVFETDVYNVRYDDPDFILRVAVKLGKADIIYCSDNEDVVTVDAQGNVRIRGAGAAVITASMEEDDDYYAAAATVQINVAKADTPAVMPLNGKREAEVPSDAEKTGDISLPWGWRWKNPDQELIPGGIVKAIAVYDETANYEYYERVIELKKMAEIVNEASDDSYIIGKDGHATIKCTGALSEFRGVSVDGIEVDPSDYILMEGSTILTFAKAYLDGLEPGAHIVTLSYTAGDVEATLTVLESPEEPISPTETPTPGEEEVNPTGTPMPGEEENPTETPTPGGEENVTETPTFGEEEVSPTETPMPGKEEVSPTGITTPDEASVSVTSTPTESVGIVSPTAIPESGDNPDSTPEAVQTGDEAPIAQFFVLFIFSLILCSYLIKKQLSQ